MSKEVEQLVCQYCKHFSNNPGWCKKKKDHQARKGTCRYFERKR